MKRLQLKDNAEPKFVSVCEQMKNEVRSKLIDRIRETITQVVGYCATEDENLVVDMSEVSKYKHTMQVEVHNSYTDDRLFETRTLDRLEVDCGDGLWLYDTEEEEYDAKDLDTDILFTIGILIDEWYHNICLGK